MATVDEVYEHPPDPRVQWPRATIFVHFHLDAGECVVYQQQLELLAGSGYAQAIDRLLNLDSEGHPRSDQDRPRGKRCTQIHRRKG